MTSDIRIRRYLPSDVDLIYEAVIESKAELSVWMPWCHASYSRQDSESWVAGRDGAWERKEEYCFVIVDGGGQLLGTCGIHRIDQLNRCGELGYWVRTSATGRGIATAATVQLSRWAFYEAGLHRLEILTSVENQASQRVAEKSGAVREGVMQQRFQLNGRWHDCVINSLLADR